jgi:hypothetical protein
LSTFDVLSQKVLPELHFCSLLRILAVCLNLTSNKEEPYLVAIVVKNPAENKNSLKNRT